MKNCLTVLVVLLLCFTVAAILTMGLGTNWGNGYKGGDALIVGRWECHDDSGKYDGLQVNIVPDRIDIDVLPPGQSRYQRYEAKGQWRSHAFYADSNTDSSQPVVVASEFPSEDLEVNLGYFLPSQPDKVTCVLFMRNTDGYHPYPTRNSGVTVTYPPPKGLFRPGMLEADIKTLPWQTAAINYSSSSVDYVYRSDRSDLPQLVVTVQHGRVIQVVGGAEETADIPYTQPPPANLDDTGASSATSDSWVGWLFMKLFSN